MSNKTKENCLLVHQFCHIRHEGAARPYDKVDIALLLLPPGMIQRYEVRLAHSMHVCQFTMIARDYCICCDAVAGAE